MPSAKARKSAAARKPAKRSVPRPPPKRKSAPPKKGKPATPAKPAPPISKAKAPAPATKKGSVAPKEPPAAVPVVRSPDGRRHVLSLSFLRDGDEFLARLESDAGQITELKNRSLDQLLTLVANELEDLLE